MGEAWAVFFTIFAWFAWPCNVMFRLLWIVLVQACLTWDRTTANRSVLIFLWCSQMAGLIVGGSWGFYEGATKPEGRTSRLRMNSLLNGLTRRGPFMGNTLASLGKPKQCCFLSAICYSLLLCPKPALMYSPLEAAIGTIRGVQDNSNSIAAAGITGLLYKSTGEQPSGFPFFLFDCCLMLCHFPIPSPHAISWTQIYGCGQCCWVYCGWFLPSRVASSW